MAREVIIDVNIQGTKDVLSLQKEIRQLKKEIKSTEEGTVAYDKLVEKLTVAQAKLVGARKDAREFRNEIIAQDKTNGAYDRLNAKLNVSRRRMKDLAASGKTNTAEFRKLRREVNLLDKELKKIDASTGQFQRNVGNYRSALRGGLRGIAGGLGGGIAGGLGAGLLGGGPSGGPGTSGGANILGGIAGGIRGFGRFGGPVGIILSEVVGQLLPLLPNLIDQLFNTKSAFDRLVDSVDVAKTVSESYSNQIEDLAGNLFDQKLEIESLVATARDENASKEEQAKAVQKLIDLSGDFLSAKERERVLNGEIELAQRAATKALIENLLAQQQRTALQETFQKLTKRTFDIQKAQDEKLQDELAKRQREFRKSSEELQKDLATFERIKEAGGSRIISVEGAQRNLQESRERVRKALRAISSEEVEKLEKELREETVKTLKPEGKKLVKSIQEGKDVSRLVLETVSDEVLESGVLDGLRPNTQTANAERQRTTERARSAFSREQERIRQEEERNQKRQQDNLLREVESYNKNRIRLDQSLVDELARAQSEYLDEQIQNIEDAEEKQIASINRRFEKEKQSREKSLQETEKQIQEELALLEELIEKDKRLGGKNQADLQEDLQAAKKRGEELIELKRRFALIEIEQEKQKQKQIAEVRENAQAKELRDLIDRFKKEQQAREREFALRRNAVSEGEVTGGLTSAEAEDQRTKIAVENIKSQLLSLQKQKEAINKSEVEDKKARLQEIEVEESNLALKRAQIEAQTQERQRAQRLEEQRQEIQYIQTLTNTFGTALDLTSNFLNEIDQRREQVFNRQLERQEQEISILQEKLDGASGLERKFLQDRITRERRAANKISDDKAKASRRFAKIQKGIAISQAIINGALGVTAVLRDVIDKTPIQIFKTIAIIKTLATTAAQVALIAAQPLATGGVVGKNIRGQRINRPNGDDTLTTLKTGEVVLNKQQQALLGGPQTFKSIGVPGFQTGGLIGPILPAPRVERIRSVAQNNELMERVTTLALETAQRIDRIEVVYTADTEQAIEEDRIERKSIEFQANL